MCNIFFRGIDSQGIFFSVHSLRFVYNLYTYYWAIVISIQCTSCLEDPFSVRDRHFAAYNILDSLNSPHSTPTHSTPLVQKYLVTPKLPTCYLGYQEVRRGNFKCGLWTCMYLCMYLYVLEYMFNSMRIVSLLLNLNNVNTQKKMKKICMNLCNITLNVHLLDALLEHSSVNCKHTHYGILTFHSIEFYDGEQCLY